jgi:chaperone modulatory protein CbpM
MIMASAQSTVLVGHIVEEGGALNLDQLCELCAIERQQLIELVEEGVLETHSSTEPRFGSASFRRVRIAMRLQRDLGLNIAGVALVVELLDRIEFLEGRR